MSAERHTGAQAADGRALRPLPSLLSPTAGPTTPIGSSPGRASTQCCWASSCSTIAAGAGPLGGPPNRLRSGGRLLLQFAAAPPSQARPEWTGME